MTQSFDTFKAENAVLEQGEALLADAGTTAVGAEDYRTLLKAYRKLLRTSQRLMKLSDNNEAGLREANDRILSQQQELEQAFQDLRDTQEQLVQAEKMAALAGLVAGVAHEINTPVGIALTAATTLSDEAAALRTQLDAGQAKKSHVTGFLDTARESTRLITGHCQRAAELIKSFKQVAVDQSSDERRTVALGAYLQEVLVSLGPELRKTRVTVRVDCPAEITANLYPGALSQIVTNLVMNSVIHGFDDGTREGTITLHLATSPDTGLIELKHADTGKGLPPEIVPRIFDPFFTTRRGSGGSGLGLSIVHNLVTQRLGGTIQVSDTPGGGATFTIRFPVPA